MALLCSVPLSLLLFFFALPCHHLYVLKYSTTLFDVDTSAQASVSGRTGPRTPPLKPCPFIKHSLPQKAEWVYQGTLKIWSHGGKLHFTQEPTD